MRALGSMPIVAGHMPMSLKKEHGLGLFA